MIEFYFPSPELIFYGVMFFALACLAFVGIVCYYEIKEK